MRRRSAAFAAKNRSLSSRAFAGSIAGGAAAGRRSSSEPPRRASGTEAAPGGASSTMSRARKSGCDRSTAATSGTSPERYCSTRGGGEVCRTSRFATAMRVGTSTAARSRNASSV